MIDDEFVVLDIETTGLSKNFHRITEIAAVKVKNGEIIGEYQTLVNPETHIPSFITKLTGISNEMVSDSPKIDRVLNSFSDFLGSSVIVAHNATFDYGFIDYNLQKYHGKNLENEKICTRRLASRLLPDLPNKKLSTIAESFGVVNENAHRAMADVKATTEIFLRFLDLLHSKGCSNLSDIVNFQNKPRSTLKN
ncbi:3'-5' exoribonuclease [Candidatus Woesearchaeota archaeon]|nr:3'-5' exoribonuclease [Candidatus Woesearchaeota archaeon]